MNALPIEQWEGHLLNCGPAEVVRRTLLENQTSRMSFIPADFHVHPAALRVPPRERIFRGAVDGAVRFAESEAADEDTVSVARVPL